MKGTRCEGCSSQALVLANGPVEYREVEGATWWISRWPAKSPPQIILLLTCFANMLASSEPMTFTTLAPTMPHHPLHIGGCQQSVASKVFIRLEEVRESATMVIWAIQLLYPCLLFIVLWVGPSLSFHLFETLPYIFFVSPAVFSLLLYCTY